MPLPRWLAATNRRVTNRILGRIPRRISPFVIVHHIGRNSGRRYATPLAGFRTSSGLILTPTYGLTADWVRNILAAESFDVDRKGTLMKMANARIVDRTDAWPFLPVLVRGAMRVLRIESFVQADQI